MARLSDMEELAGKILDPNAKEFMREALTCYMTGAYRATIVLTYIALFDDIYKKLEQLAKINKIAKEIFISASRKRKEQEPFEYDLITSLKKTGLMTDIESTFLDILRELRNKSAHPSGHTPSAEEARFIFHESINRFLSKPILSTTKIVESIIEKLADSNLFHDVQVDQLAKVAQKETSNLHEKALPLLITKLVEALDDDSVSVNSQRFLCGFAYEPIFKNSLSLIRTKLIEEKVSNSFYAPYICELLSSNGSLYDKLHEVTYGRLDNLLMKKIQEGNLQLQYEFLEHPITVFISLFEKNDPEVVLSLNSKSFDALLKKYLFIPYFIEQTTKFTAVKNHIGKNLYESASSTNKNTANNFAKKIHLLDDVLSENYSERFSLILLSGIMIASNNGALSAQNLIRTKFTSIPKIKANAKEYISKNPDESKVSFIDAINSEDEYDYLTQNLLK